MKIITWNVNGYKSAERQNNIEELIPKNNTDMIDTIAIIILLNGGRKKENHPYKFAILNKFLSFIKKLDKSIIVCTDFNITHHRKRC